MSLLEQALRAIRSSIGHPQFPSASAHIHVFSDTDTCECGRTFDQAITSDTDHFVLELNPCGSE